MRTIIENQESCALYSYTSFNRVQEKNKKNRKQNMMDAYLLGSLLLREEEGEEKSRRGREKKRQRIYGQRNFEWRKKRELSAREVLRNKISRDSNFGANFILLASFALRSIIEGCSSARSQTVAFTISRRRRHSNGSEVWSMVVLDFYALSSCSKKNMEKTLVFSRPFFHQSNNQKEKKTKEQVNVQKGQRDKGTTGGRS